MRGLSSSCNHEPRKCCGFRSILMLQQASQDLVSLPLLTSQLLKCAPWAALPSLQAHILTAWQHQQKENFFFPAFSVKAPGLDLSGSDGTTLLSLNESGFSGCKLPWGARSGSQAHSRAEAGMGSVPPNCKVKVTEVGSPLDSREATLRGRAKG